MGTPYNPDNRLVCGGFILGSDHPHVTKLGGRFHYMWGTEYDFTTLVEACEAADFIVAHNAKFELGWLHRCGLDIDRTLSYCTQIGEYVLAGNRKMRLSLDHSLARYGLEGKVSIVSKLMHNGVCPSEMPMDLLENYGRVDVLQTHKLFLRQRKRLAKKRLLPVMFTRNIFTVPLIDIEQHGMHLDKDRVITIYRTFTKQLQVVQTKLDKITGGINFRSPSQRAVLLYKTLRFAIPTDHRGNELRNKPDKKGVWPEGVPKTDKKTMAKLKPRNAQQREFLELYAEVKKLDDSITKFLSKFAACIEETDDHILHASMNQTKTSTHRLSSSGLKYKVQFQNFDRRFKPLFSPRYPGWSIGEADEAQLEYRTAVELGQDEVGLQDILHQTDAHAITASIIFKEEWQACRGDKKSPVGKAVRTAAKSHTFKPLYGGTSGTPREQEYYQFFKDKHPGITAVQEDWVDTVYRTKKLRVASGLIFYWEDCRLNKYGKLIRPDGRPADQSICNYPVQSLATAEIVPVGVVFLYHYMKAAKMQSFLVNTVHDSAIGEIHPNEGELFKLLAVQSMEKEVITYLEQVYNMQFNTPLEAEVELRSHWSGSSDWESEYLNAA